MVHRGSFNLAVMLIINPFVILFYQNCTMAPNSYASRPTQTIQRQISSVQEETKIEKKAEKPCNPHISQCAE